MKDIGFPVFFGMQGWLRGLVHIGVGSGRMLEGCDLVTRWGVGRSKVGGGRHVPTAIKSILSKPEIREIVIIYASGLRR